MQNLPIMHSVTVTVRGAKEIADRIKRVPQKLELLEDSFWMKKSNTYKIFAKWIVLNVVYGAYQPRFYNRTYNLRDSIKSERLTDGFVIYQDPHMTPEAETAKVHRWPSYAFYFIYGGGFLAMTNAKPQRDFLAAWYKYFKPKFKEDYRNEVVRPALTK